LGQNAKTIGTNPGIAGTFVPIVTQSIYVNCSGYKRRDELLKGNTLSDASSEAQQRWRNAEKQWKCA